MALSLSAKSGKRKGEKIVLIKQDWIYLLEGTSIRGCSEGREKHSLERRMHKEFIENIGKKEKQI